MTRLAPLLALALAALAGSPAATAATLTVQVLGADGQPAAHTVVELVSPAPPRPLPTAAVQVSQRDVRFVPFVTALPAGATVRFLNQDGFDHHLRSLPSGPLGTVPPARSFELRMAPGSPAQPSATELVFEQPGVVALGCHLHGSMRGHLYIGRSAHLAVTDAEGRARLPDVPDGRLELRLWHPEQLLDQPPANTQAAGEVAQPLRLNFTPPPPRRARRV